MDSIQKELEKLHKRLPALVEPKGYNAEASSAASLSKAKDTNSNVFYALDQLIQTFEEAQQRLARHESSIAPPIDPTILLSELRASVGQAQRGVNERQKEYYSALSKLGKALEKKFPTSTASLTDSRIFTSVQAQHSLESVVLEHFLRNGDWDLAEELAKEAHLTLPSQTARSFSVLHSTLRAIEAGDLSPAVAWAQAERPFLRERGSVLEYGLHRSRFLRIALGFDTSEDFEGMEEVKKMAAERDVAPPQVQMAERYFDPDGEMVDAMEMSVGDLAVPSRNPAADTSDWADTNINRAMCYGRHHFNAFSEHHLGEIQKLLTFLLFLPVIVYTPDLPAAEPLRVEELHYFVPGPYRHFLQADKMHAPFLTSLFELEYCIRQGIAKDSPLRIAVDVGAGGALNKILKVRAVMKESKTEWSQAEELPIEIPLPSHLRFHSIFCCPVSKEQGTDENPPMIMACGHVVCKESLTRLGKGTGDYRKVKCPYCPAESTIGQAKRVYF